MLKGLTPIPFKLVSVASGAARFDLVAFTLASLVFARDRERAICADDIGKLPRREEPQHGPTGTRRFYRRFEVPARGGLAHVASTD